MFISHADRDHLTGLLQFNQLNARSGFPVIYYPKDCGSFPALKEFTTKFDPQCIRYSMEPHYPRKQSSHQGRHYYQSHS